MTKVVCQSVIKKNMTPSCYSFSAPPLLLFLKMLFKRNSNCFLMLKAIVDF